MRDFISVFKKAFLILLIIVVLWALQTLFKSAYMPVGTALAFANIIVGAGLFAAFMLGGNGT